MAQSKHNQYLPGYKPSQVIHHEWRTAENSAAYLLPTLHSMREQKPKLQFLDVGAGSGTISVGFARHLPEGQVTATDLSDEILRRAEGLAATAGMPNMKFQQADAYQLPFPDASFDVAHCHQMLCHMDAPGDALREMLRVTRPGGVVAAREADMATQCIWPEAPGLRRFHALSEGIFEVAGACWTGGRQLLSWALEAGARRDQITAGYGTWCFSAPEDKNVWGK